MVADRLGGRCGAARFGRIRGSDGAGRCKRGHWVAGRSGAARSGRSRGSYRPGGRYRTGRANWADWASGAGRLRLRLRRDTHRSRNPDLWFRQHYDLCCDQPAAGWRSRNGNSLYRHHLFSHGTSGMGTIRGAYQSGFRGGRSDLYARHERLLFRMEGLRRRFRSHYSQQRAECAG